MSAYVEMLVLLHVDDQPYKAGVSVVQAYSLDNPSQTCPVLLLFTTTILGGLTWYLYLREARLMAMTTWIGEHSISSHTRGSA